MQITNVRPILKGIMVASVTITLPKWGGFFIKDITVFDKQGNRWIAFPSDPYEKDGVKKYARKCGYEDRDMQKKFEIEFFKAFDEYVKQNPLQPPAPKQQQTWTQPSFGNDESDPWY